jgi:diaminopimelate epimerase
MIMNTSNPHAGDEMRFHKYQALGNDYLVLDAAIAAGLSVPVIRKLCDRHYGIGGDGVLTGERSGNGFALRIFNPDGSETEKSGNGIRIFARYLWDSGAAGAEPFKIITKGGVVTCQVRDGGRLVFVEMGRASFDSAQIPVAGPAREVVGESIEIEGEGLRFTAVTVGNPHCVIHAEEISPQVAKRLGPLIETHTLFPNRTNVQFVQVIDAHHIKIEIWERGAGYTFASGSSSCAAAAASVKLGYCKGNITVTMPGGSLEIGVKDDYSLTMLGPVAKVASGAIAEEALEDLIPKA